MVVKAIRYRATDEHGSKVRLEVQDGYFRLDCGQDHVVLFDADANDLIQHLRDHINDL
jgi:hypothetical protein